MKLNSFNVNLVSPPPLVILTKGVNISGGHCIYLQKSLLNGFLPCPMYSKKTKVATFCLLKMGTRNGNSQRRKRSK